MLRDLIFLLAALLCEILGTIGGFGSSVFFVPVAQFFYSFQFVLGITGIFHVFSNASKLILFGKHVNYRLLFFYGIPSVGFVIFGAYLITIVSFEWAAFSLGIFFSAFQFDIVVFFKTEIAAE
ncbi:MAG: TSUP family transporter [Bacteroidia bacterium]